jgi:acetylornithine deacetylase/succinyl-diaminopimelate desuccinylase-like protein
MLPNTVVELLQALVRVPSVNPTGDPGTDQIGEERCARFVAELLRDLGTEPEVREVLPGRPNVVARFPSDRPGKPRLLFAPHTDTVSVAGMTIDPFGGELRDGRIWGRGASDTKGSMAAMLWALRENLDEIPRLSHEIWFAGLAGEEAGQQGSKALAEEERFDFVIAGEPTGMNPVFTHKGSTHLFLTAVGKAGHSSNPSAGVNAIYRMAEVIRTLRSEVAPLLADYHDPVLGASTMSVGTINGGSKTNIIPDHCEMSVDIRTVPGQVTPEFLANLEFRLRAACPDLQVRMSHATPLYTDPAHPLIQLLLADGAKLVGAPWFCDAAVFARKGTPAIALGPGSIAQAHTDDEWLAVADLEAGAAAFSRFIRGLGNQ